MSATFSTFGISLIMSLIGSRLSGKLNDGVTFFLPILRSYFRSVLIEVGQSIDGTMVFEGLASLLEESYLTCLWCEDNANEESVSLVVYEYLCKRSLYFSCSDVAAIFKRSYFSSSLLVFSSVASGTQH